MIEMILEECTRHGYSEISIGIQEKHNQEYNATEILHHLCEKLDINLTVLTIKGLSRGPADTVHQIINNHGIKGPIIVKDADNLVSFPNVTNKHGLNFIVTGSLREFNISDVHSKSFVKLDQRGLIQDIFEKQIISSEVCLGVYGFDQASDYLQSYAEVSTINISTELYVSMVISNLILNGHLFNSIRATAFTDWGVWARWKDERKKFSTYFIDFDGTLVKNTGRFGHPNWDSEFEPLIENLIHISKLYKEGAQIIITTSRPLKYKGAIKSFLKEWKIIPKYVITNLYHSTRIIINDHAETNPFPSCKAISIPRDGNILEYLDD